VDGRYYRNFKKFVLPLIHELIAGTYVPSSVSLKGSCIGNTLGKLHYIIVSFLLRNVVTCSALSHNMACLLDDMRLQDFTAVHTPTAVFSFMVACSLASGHKLFSGRCSLRLQNIGNYRTIGSLGMLIYNYQSTQCQDEESYNVTVTGKSRHRKNGWHRKAKVIVEMSAPLSPSLPRYRQKSLPIVPFKSPGRTRCEENIANGWPRNIYVFCIGGDLYN